MHPRLADVVAVVTGAADGIGRAVALRFAQEGAAVAIVDRDGRRARQVSAEVVASGGRAAAFEADVTDAAAVEAALAAVDASLGVLSVLVNCAGGSRAEDGPLDTVDLRTLDATLALDLGGTVRCIRAAVPRLRARGGGAIVNLASYVALDGSSRTHAYVAAKGAVVALTRSLAGTYARDGIRVNAIAPGIVLSDRIRARLADQGTDLAALRASLPFAVATPDQLAPVAVFLASDDSRTITGCTLPADGGLSAKAACTPEPA